MNSLVKNWILLQDNGASCTVLGIEKLRITKRNPHPLDHFHKLGYKTSGKTHAFRFDVFLEHFTGNSISNGKPRYKPGKQAIGNSKEVGKE